MYIDSLYNNYALRDLYMRIIHEIYTWELYMRINKQTYIKYKTNINQTLN
jgi:hypothetical protein